MKAGAVGICVDKVSEAEALVNKGYPGVLVTSPVVADYKIERLMQCMAQDPQPMKETYSGFVSTFSV